MYYKIKLKIEHFFAYIVFLYIFSLIFTNLGGVRRKLVLVQECLLIALLGL